MTRPHVRAYRPISIPSVPVSEGIEIRHGQFISSLVRALAKLPGGIGRFLPGGIGSHMSRLSWMEPVLESCHHQCLKAVCGSEVGVPRWYVTIGHVPDDRRNVVKRVRLTRKTRPGCTIWRMEPS